MVNISNSRGGVPRSVTADVYYAGRSGDMAGQGGDVHLEAGRFSAEALRADSEGVYPLKEPFLYIGIERVGVYFAYRAGKLALCRKGAGLDSASDGDAEDYGRAGVASGTGYGIDDEVLELGYRRRGQEHLKRALVFAAEALWRNGEGEPVALDEAGMDNGGGVIARVHTAEGVGDHALAKAAVNIPPAHTLVHSILERAGDMRVLPYVGENDRHSGVLAYWQPLAGGALEISYYIVQRGAGGRRGLFALCLPERGLHILAEQSAGLYAEPFNGLGYKFCFDLSQRYHLAPIVAQKTWAAQ